MFESIRLVLSSEATHCLIHLSVFFVSIVPPVLQKYEPLLLRAPVGLISWIYLAIFCACTCTLILSVLCYTCCFRYFMSMSIRMSLLCAYYSFNVIIHSLFYFWSRRRQTYNDKLYLVSMFVSMSSRYLDICSLVFF